MTRLRRADSVIIAVLILGTMALYARTCHFQFTNFDDDQYVSENSHVVTGLSLANVQWAFTTMFGSNYHPLTWVSLMTDVELSGVNPGWIHFENALLHTANSALLFIALLGLTHARWPSAWVAAMFAWHPVHVESVAWIAERKDVLSMFFWMLCIIGYVHWVRTRDRRAYWAAVIALLLGLLAKPMVVTLPFALLLLDFWPLRRSESLRELVKEKGWMFAAIALASTATFIAQSAGRSVAPVHKFPMQLRLINATTSAMVYLRQIFWPRGLAIFYPMTVQDAAGNIQWAPPVAGAILLIAITTLAILARRRMPWVLFGWLWYIGTLVPVIGIVQVGSQAHADRYTYIPSIGIFIAVAWCARFVYRRRAAWRALLAILGIGSIVACSVLTWRQVGTWRDSFTVMQHAVDVVPNNYVAMGSLGEAYDRVGDPETARKYYLMALAIRPDDPLTLNNLAVQAVRRGDDDESLKLYRKSLWGDPNYGPAYNNYGNLLMRKARSDDAILVYRAGIKHDPEFAPIRHNLALALAGVGKLDEAMELWRAAIELDPHYADAHESYGDALIMKGQPRQGIAELRESLALAPDRLGALKSLAWTLATHPNPLYQDGAEAEKLAHRAVELTQGKDAIPLDTLAAAEARAGRFDQAITDAQRALAIAQGQNPALADQIRHRLELYQSHQPFTSGR